jgi:cell division transport system permease protein
VNLLALGTLAATLFIAGLALLVVSNLERHVASLRDDLRVYVYLLDTANDSERRSLEAELAALPSVERVAFVDRDEALRRYRVWAAELARLAQELEPNPLPASLEVFLVPGAGATEAAAAVAERAAAAPIVESVTWDREWLARLEGLLRIARVGGTVLGLAVFAAVAFIIAAVLRLAVHARRDEIEIMQLVGATSSFIRGPFLAAGLAHGLAASVVALAAVELARRAALVEAEGARGLIELAAAGPLTPSAALALVGTGLGVSLAGSWLAVRLD